MSPCLLFILINSVSLFLAILTKSKGHDGLWVNQILWICPDEDPTLLETNPLLVYGKKWFTAPLEMVLFDWSV